MNADDVSFAEIQREAKRHALRFVDLADGCGDADEAARWSLAAKNTMDVAVSCDRAVELKTRAKLNTARRS